MKRKSRAAPQKCGNHGVCEISAPVQQWAAEGELRARRNEHLTLENTILRRRSTSAFSHSQDPQETSLASPHCNATNRCGERRDLVNLRYLLCCNEGSYEAFMTPSGQRW